MKRVTSLLIGCSLALAGLAFAQQPETQESPAKNKKAPVEKTERPEAKANANAERPHRGGAKANVNGNANANGGASVNGKANGNADGNVNAGGNANGANPEMTQKPLRGNRAERNAVRGQKGKANAARVNETNTGANINPNAEANAAAGATVAPNAKQQARQNRRGGKNTGANANANANAKAKASVAPVTAASPSATAAVSTGAAAATTTAVAPNNQGNRQGNLNANAKGAALNKPAPEKLQQIKEQHASFRAQARPDKVPAVTFQANYRIQGSDRWQGPQYEVFRSYHPERHDRNWYHSRYQRVELIGGGYYYWNDGYWYPAWGYSPSEEYYAYDAPIYVGHRAEPPDRVIADVQAELQDMGYYRGEVDGLLGPLTREALTAYQADEGLITTSVIDEPTLNSLGMS